MSDLDKDRRPVSQEQIDAAKKLWRQDERRMMDYFWNRRSGSHREHVPTSVIYWLEGERGNSDRGRIDFELSDLATGNSSNLLGEANYIAKMTVGGEEGYELTKSGISYLTKKHPTVLQYWEKALELSPPTMTLLVAIVGFVASVFGIIQFVDWYRHLK